jgi:hypothetical protein
MDAEQLFDSLFDLPFVRSLINLENELVGSFLEAGALFSDDRLLNNHAFVIHS